jgi:dephospho-CoA kinase
MNKNIKNNILIGITGGIGSGKSAVSDYLSGLGENVIYSDETARKVVMPGQPGYEGVRRGFGDEFFTAGGLLDRKKLARYVFGNKEKLEKLNGILHPIILDQIYRETERLKGRVFIEVPLLIKSGMHEKMDFVWLVTADEDTRIMRVKSRDGLDETLIKQRMDNQMSDGEMAAFADEIIDNGGNVQDLYKKIDSLLRKPEYGAPKKSKDFLER